MVQEIRQIALGADELMAAVEGYRRVVPEFLPEGTITRCEAMDNGMVIVCVEIMRDGFSRPSEFTFRSFDLLKPIVCFCLQNGVALPKNGRATAVIDAGSVTFRVTRNMDVVIPAWIAAARLDRIKSVTDLSPADMGLDEPAIRSGT